MSPTTTTTARIRLVAINGVYDYTNLPKLQTFLSKIKKPPNAVIVPGNFLARSSQLSQFDDGHSCIQTLPTCGITHLTFGHDESQIELSILKQRVQQLSSSWNNNDNINNKNKVQLINTNVRSQDIKQENEYTRIFTNQEYWNDILKMTPSYSMITSDCQRVNVALLGLFSDEGQGYEAMVGPGRRNDNNRCLFGRGSLPVDNVLESYQHQYELFVNKRMIMDEGGVGGVNDGSDDKEEEDEEELTAIEMYVGIKKKKKKKSSPRQPQQHTGERKKTGCNVRADFIVPITHQSMKRNQELALQMLHTDRYNDQGLIIAGATTTQHCDDDRQHKDMTQRGNVRDENDLHRIFNIITTGNNAQEAASIDLEFDCSDSDGDDMEQSQQRPKLVNLTFEHIELESSYEDSFVVKTIIDNKMKIITDLENEIIVDLSTQDDEEGGGMVLSSETNNSSSSSTKETSVGTFFCDAIQYELHDADVTILNRGVVTRGGTTYPDNKMTYSQLRKELPPAIQIIVLPMTRLQLYQSISYSRMNSNIEIDGYLQTNSAYEHHASVYPDNPDEIVQVALPRHLLFEDDDEEHAGYDANDVVNLQSCKIQPLLQLGKKLGMTHVIIPNSNTDSAISALDLVTRYCCNDRWVNIIKTDNGISTFGDIDLNQDGVLDKHEITVLLRKVLGYEPDDTVVDDMITSIDADGNGVIDEDEFGYILAKLEREKNA